MSKRKTKATKRERSVSPTIRQESVKTKRGKASSVVMSDAFREIKTSMNPKFGLGLFVKSDVKKNQIIANMGGTLITAEQAESLPIEQKGRQITWDSKYAFGTILESLLERRLNIEIYKNIFHQIGVAMNNIEEPNERYIKYRTKVMERLDHYDEHYNKEERERRVLADEDLLEWMFKSLDDYDLVLDVSTTESFAKYANDPKGDSLKRKSNAKMVFGADGISFDLIATRNIKAGEEILIDYGEQYFQ